MVTLNLDITRHICWQLWRCKSGHIFLLKASFPWVKWVCEHPVHEGPVRIKLANVAQTFLVGLDAHCTEGSLIITLLEVGFMLGLIMSHFIVLCIVQSGRLKEQKQKHKNNNKKTLANAHDIATKYISVLLGKLFPGGKVGHPDDLSWCSLDFCNASQPVHLH